jgi:hypothetical protein
MDKHKVGLTFGAFLGFWHLIWSILVAIGAAQMVLDFIYSIHFLNNPFTIQAFSLGHAVTLVVVTSIIGYVIGWGCAAFWNRFSRQQ